MILLKKPKNNQQLFVINRVVKFDIAYNFEEIIYKIKQIVFL
jgi:hypothetical protein